MHLILTRPGRRRPVATRRLRDAMLSPAHHACTSTSARIALCLPAVASTPHTTQAGSTPRGAHPLSGDLSARLPSSDGCTEYGLLRPLIDLLRGSVCGLFGLDQQGLEIVLLRRLPRLGDEGLAERHGKVTHDANRCTNEVIAHEIGAARRLGNLSQEVHRGRQVRLEGRALVVRTQALQHARVRLKDALAQPAQVLGEIRIGDVHGRQPRLLQHAHGER
mmetsp:Transcript_3318/g.11180  ORF Transcript_3318/g.11180 Transcript_3318/m.11180 type:complete len:220 (-) Transcript_3318:2262-2921(-)